MREDNLAEGIALVKQALASRQARISLRDQIQKMIWSRRNPGEEDPVWRILRDLAWDLEFYAASEEVRREDPVFYGDEEFEARVRAALAALGAQGVVSDED